MIMYAVIALAPFTNTRTSLNNFITNTTALSHYHTKGLPRPDHKTPFCTSHLSHLGALNDRTRSNLCQHDHEPHEPSHLVVIRSHCSRHEKLKHALIAARSR